LKMKDFQEHRGIHRMHPTVFTLYVYIDLLLCSSHWDKRTLNNEVMTAYISR